MGIKSIDDVDVEKLKEELLSQTVNTEETRDGVSKYNDSGDRIYMKMNGVEYWEGSLSDKTKVKIVAEDGILEEVNLENPEAREKFSFLPNEKFNHSDGSTKWFRFNEDGERLYFKSKYGEKVEETIYDPRFKNKKIKHTITINGEPYLKETWDHTDNGELKYYRKDKNGSFILENIYEYDDKNRVIHTIQINAYGKIEITNEYDDKDRLIKKVKIVNETNKSEEIFKYDDNDKFVYHKSINNDGSVDEIIKDYDEEGRITKEETKHDGKTIKKEETTYEGDITKIHTWTEQKETWEEKQNYAILLKKERSLLDFKPFADLLDTNRIPIITTIDNRHLRI